MRRRLSAYGTSCILAGVVVSSAPSRDPTAEQRAAAREWLKNAAVVNHNTGEPFNADVDSLAALLTKREDKVWEVGDCTHDLAEQETACADGYCPLCLQGKVARLIAAGDRLRRDLDGILRRLEGK